MLKPKSLFFWRRSCQISFAVLTLIIGIQFIRFVNCVSGSDTQQFISRPAGVRDYRIDYFFYFYSEFLVPVSMSLWSAAWSIQYGKPLEDTEESNHMLLLYKMFNRLSESNRSR